MIADLKPYPSYKDSGVPWLGKIPEHWLIKRSKWVFHYAKETNVGRINTNVLSLTLRGVVNNNPDNPEGLVPNDYSTYQLFRKGDLVFKLIDLENLRTSRVGLVHEDGIMSSAYVRLIPRDSEIVRFFYHSFFDLYTRGVYNQFGAGVRSTLGPADLLNLPIVIPETEEQSAIVRFLDCVNQRIHRYIRTKQKLIRLLEEQKQSIIYRTVTRGLDPNIRFKPSGVEWLGDVPEHWDVVLNQRIFKESIRPHGGQPETQLSLSQKDGLIPTNEMQERSLQTSTYENWKLTLPGDLVLNRFKAHLGVFFAATLRGIVSFHYGVFAPRRKLIVKYFELLYHTNVYKAIYAGRSNGMTVGLQNLSNQNFYNVHSVVPPVHEQAEIVQSIKESTHKLSDAIFAAQREISLIREYRARLIADVVTGKLDVRVAASKLQEEIEPAEEVEELSEEIDETNGDVLEAEGAEV